MLPGERTEPADAEDAEHWLQVYEELRSFLRNLLDSCSANGDDLEEHRYRALTTRLGWINQRLRYWEERRRELRRASRPY